MSDPSVNLNIEVDNDLSKTPVFEPRDWYPSSQAQELVRKFHEAFDEPIGHQPQSIGPIRGFLRVDLIKTALEDFEKAVNDDYLLEQYDALIEILLLTYGTLVEMGVDAGPGKREVMRSKMSVLNGPHEKADLFSVLTKQGWRPSYEDYLKYNNLKDPREVLQALAGRPDIHEEVLKFVPEEDPDADALIQVKRGVRHNGEDYFQDEPHAYTRLLYHNGLCVCGKIEADPVHVVASIEPPMPRRKDNFHDRVMSGWVPTREEQDSYEIHRQELERQYPTTKWVGDKLTFVVYSHGEKDVDWDFETNAPKVKNNGN